MATIITHPIVPIAAAYLIGREKVSPKLMFVACVASIVPDADVIAFRFDIPYGDQYGHRGFTHSISFAVLMGVIATFFSSYFNTSKVICYAMVFIGCVSHGVLDAFTNGGYGIAFFWPITVERYFFPWQPIEVSPIGVARFLSPRGLEVLISELWTVWLPALAVIFWMKRKSSKA